MILFITSSLTWCVLKSMCFPQADTCLFVASDFLLYYHKKLLSANLFSSSQGSLSAASQYNFRLQVTCFPQSENAIYSDPVGDRTIIVGLLVRNAIGVPLLIIIQPVFGLRVWLHPTLISVKVGSYRARTRSLAESRMF